MKPVRPIFVLGCPRSGTTLLQLTLHGHPRMAIPPETRFVLEGYKIRRSFGDLSQLPNRRRLAGWIVDRQTSAFDDLGLDPDSVRDEITQAGYTLGTATGTVLRAYARRFGKARWGDKRPAYVTNIPVLRRLFPTAQFVHIIRDGRDCVASLKAMPWHRAGVTDAISAWAQAIDHGRWAARTLPPDSYHEVSYERLVRDPEPELVVLCRFLGEEYHAAMTAPAVQAAFAVPAAKTWHARTRQPIGTDRVGRWVDVLSPAEAGLCEHVLGSRLQSHGYAVHGLPPPPVQDRLRYESAAVRHRLAPARRALTELLDRIPSARPVADTC
jgi:hypothetical protein